MKKTFKIILFSAIVLIYITIIILLHIGSNSETILQISTTLRESLFYLSLIQIVVLIKYKRIHFYATLIFFIVAIFLSLSKVLTKHLHILTTNLVGTDYIGNPQFFNIYLFILIFTIALFHFTKEKHKTFDQFFALQLSLIIFVTIYIFHQATILHGSAVVIEHETNALSKIINSKKFHEECFNNNYNCVEIKNQVLTYQNGSPELIEYLKKNIFNKLINSNSTIFGRFAHPLRDESFRYLAMSTTSPEKKRYIISYELPEKAQKKQFYSFNYLALCAHLFWFLFTYLLIFLHNNRAILRRYFNLK